VRAHASVRVCMCVGVGVGGCVCVCVCVVCVYIYIYICRYLFTANFALNKYLHTVASVGFLFT